MVLEMNISERRHSAILLRIATIDPGYLGSFIWKNGTAWARTVLGNGATRRCTLCSMQLARCQAIRFKIRRVLDLPHLLKPETLKPLGSSKRIEERSLPYRALWRFFDSEEMSCSEKVCFAVRWSLKLKIIHAKGLESCTARVWPWTKKRYLFAVFDVSNLMSESLGRSLNSSFCFSHPTTLTPVKRVDTSN